MGRGKGAPGPKGRGRPPPPWRAVDRARAAFEYPDDGGDEWYDEDADEEFGVRYEWDGDEWDAEPATIGAEWTDDQWDEGYWETVDDDWWYTSNTTGESCRMVTEPAAAPTEKERRGGDYREWASA